MQGVVVQLYSEGLGINVPSQTEEEACAWDSMEPWYPLKHSTTAQINSLSSPLIIRFFGGGGGGFLTKLCCCCCLCNRLMDHVG